MIYNRPIYNNFQVYIRILSEFKNKGFWVQTYILIMDSQELRECLSLNLKKYRKIKGWSQFELAEKAQISEQTVNSIEGLRLWPSDKTLAKMANVLEIEMYRLFVPQKLAMQSESIAELKHAVVKTVENLVHDTLQDWEMR